MNYIKAKDELVQILRGQLYDLWKKENVLFLKSLVGDILIQKSLIAKELAKGVGGRPEIYRRNLQYLAATVDNEVARHKIRVAFGCRKLFVRVLKTAIRVVAVEALS